MYISAKSINIAVKHIKYMYYYYAFINNVAYKTCTFKTSPVCP